MNKPKQVVIQTNVSICPNCHGTLRFNKIAQKYICIACYSGFKIVEQGQTEREFICEPTGDDKISQEK